MYVMFCRGWYRKTFWKLLTILHDFRTFQQKRNLTSLREISPTIRNAHRIVFSTATAFSVALLTWGQAFLMCVWANMGFFGSFIKTDSCFLVLGCLGHRAESGTFKNRELSGRIRNDEWWFASTFRRFQALHTQQPNPIKTQQQQQQRRRRTNGRTDEQTSEQTNKQINTHTHTHRLASKEGSVFTPKGWFLPFFHRFQGPLLRALSYPAAPTCHK